MPLDTIRALTVSFLRLASFDAPLMSLTLTVADLPASILNDLLPRTSAPRKGPNLMLLVISVTLPLQPLVPAGQDILRLATPRLTLAFLASTAVPAPGTAGRSTVSTSGAIRSTASAVTLSAPEPPCTIDWTL